MDHHQEIAYGESNCHMTDDAMGPRKVKVMTRICIEPYISKALDDAIQQHSLITRQFAVRQYGRLSQRQLLLLVSLYLSKLFLRWLGQECGSCVFCAKTKLRKCFLVILRIQSPVIEREPILKSSASQVSSEQLVLLLTQTQNFQMKNPCRTIVHPGINLVVSFTGHQHLTMHKVCHNEGLPPVRKRSRRSHEAVNRNLCIFCGDETNGADYSFQKVTLT